MFGDYHQARMSCRSIMMRHGSMPYKVSGTAWTLKSSNRFFQHQNRINNVTVVVFTSCRLERNARMGLRLGFYRCIATKIANQQVRKSRQTDCGTLKLDGGFIRNKGDCNMVDC